MMIFLVNFQRQCSKKIRTNFPKKEDMYKSYFQWFSNVSKFMYKGTFSMISYSKSMYKDFLKYIFFIYIQKDFWMIFCCLNACIQRI